MYLPINGSATGDIEYLTDKGIIVFWGGTNVVSKNNFQGGLKHVVHFVESNSHSLLEYFY
jgi:hypothetical protein